MIAPDIITETVSATSLGAEVSTKMLRRLERCLDRVLCADEDRRGFASWRHPRTGKQGQSHCNAWRGTIEVTT